MGGTCAPGPSWGSQNGVVTNRAMPSRPKRPDRTIRHRADLGGHRRPRHPPRTTQVPNSRAHLTHRT